MMESRDKRTVKGIQTVMENIENCGSCDEALSINKGMNGSKSVLGYW